MIKINLQKENFEYGFHQFFAKTPQLQASSQKNSALVH